MELSRKQAQNKRNVRSTVFSNYPRLGHTRKFLFRYHGTQSDPTSLKSSVSLAQNMFNSARGMEVR